MIIIIKYFFFQIQYLYSNHKDPYSVSANIQSSHKYYTHSIHFDDCIVDTGTILCFALPNRLQRSKCQKESNLQNMTGRNVLLDYSIELAYYLDYSIELALYLYPLND